MKPTSPGDSVKILQLLKNREGVSIRESPGNTSHWSVPEEESLTENNDWFDLNYSPCVFGGERRIDLKMRHNIDELNNVCPLSCHRTHDVDEWECSRSSSHQEETSRTAALCFLHRGLLQLVCAASWSCGPQNRKNIEPLGMRR